LLVKIDLMISVSLLQLTNLSGVQRRHMLRRSQRCRCCAISCRVTRHTVAARRAS
jgi:hypothetical protein